MTRHRRLVDHEDLLALARGDAALEEALKHAGSALVRATAEAFRLGVIVSLDELALAGCRSHVRPVGDVEAERARVEVLAELERLAALEQRRAGLRRGAHSDDPRSHGSAQGGTGTPPAPPAVLRAAPQAVAP